MSKVLKKLNDSDMDLLEKIMGFSGYTTSVSVNKFKESHAPRGVRYILNKLCECGYLKEIPFYSDSRRDATLYQVTFKTCNLFDNPNSFFRKKHDDYYKIRALIKQHFFFEIYNDFGQHIISNHQDRVNLLTKELGVSVDILPKKYNTGVPLTHVEEYIIDARNPSGQKLICPKSGESLFDFSTYNGIIIVYVDKFESNCNSQLTTLYNRYKSIINLGTTKIDFLVVVDSEKREQFYKNAIGKMLARDSQPKVHEIHDRYIDFHMKILRDKLNVAPEKLHDLPAKIREKYSQVQEVTSNDLEGIPIKDICLNGLKAVGKMAKDILSSSGTNEQKTAGITELFGKIYKLYAAGMFKKEADFGIKIYRIGYTFSIY